MATSKLKIFNGALAIVQHRSIASLTVNEEARHALDTAYDDGAINFCLEQGQWRFAMRSSKFSYDTGITPDFGFPRAFAKPSDWCVTSAVCSDEYFNAPHLNYTDEAGYWYSDLDDLYIKYVSNHADFGMNLSLWSASFTEYVKVYLASKVCGKLAANQKLVENITKRNGMLETALLVAKNRDAMAEPTKKLPRGNWVKARTGSGGDWRDGGSRSNLIG